LKINTTRKMEINKSQKYLRKQQVYRNQKVDKHMTLELIFIRNDNFT